MDDMTMPAMFDHSVAVYNEMRANAKPVGVEGEGRMLVWEGFLTKLTKRLGLSTPYYTMVRRELIRMGCIRQLRRGGGNSASQWELVKKPTQELYNTADDSTNKAPSRLDTVDQRIKDIHERLCVVEQQMGTIISAVNNSRSA